MITTDMVLPFTLVSITGERVMVVNVRTKTPETALGYAQHYADTLSLKHVRSYDEEHDRTLPRYDMVAA